MGTHVLAPADLNADPKQSVEAMVAARLGLIALAQRRVTLFGFAVIAAFFGSLTVWSVLAPLDSAVVAEGQIVVAGNRNLVQSERGGVISQIFFNDGDRVEQGQVVVRFDDTQALAAYQQLLVQYYEVQALQARLLAERDGLEQIPFPPQLLAEQAKSVVAKAIKGQQTVFESRKQTFANQTGILNQKIKEVHDEIAGLETQVAAQKDQLALFQEETDTVSTLLDQNLIARSRFLALKRSTAELTGAKGENASRIARAQQTILEAELQIIDLRNRRMDDVLQQLRTVEAAAGDLDERLRAAKHDLEGTELRAPKTGIVVGTTVHTIGGVVGAADTLMEIVPEGDQLVVEAHIRPQDIEHVQGNLRASVRLVGFNTRRVPTVDGTVTYVSADSLLDRPTNTRYYLARIAVDLKAKPDTANLKLQPGMPAHVMVITGNRTLFDYLFSPITDSVAAAMHET